MKIFLDTANLESIRRFNDLGLLDGITTNPSLLAKEGGDPRQYMKQITEIVKGDVSLEVVAEDYEGMLEEGRRLSAYGPNVVVKVPMTPAGLRACRTLSSDGTPVNVTLVFTPSQALLAAKSGARYVSPFIGRLYDRGEDGMELVEQIADIFDNYEEYEDAEILVASVREPRHVVDAAMAGAHVATLPPAVLEQMLKHELTDQGLERFRADWQKLKSENPGLSI